MVTTTEQLRALEALDREKSFHRAAEAVGKSYSSFNYLIQGLERDLDLKLVDRSGYRSRLTAEGRAVLDYGLKLRRDVDEFHQRCRTLRSGWEPRIRIISDGIFDQRILAGAIQALRGKGVSTQVESFEAYLEEVEDEFRQRDADLMISLAPLRHEVLPSVALRPTRMVLVCAKQHPLAGKGRWRLDDLRAHDLVAIRGSKSILGLSTAELERQPTYTVGDFNSKRVFISSGLAFGWLPEEMIRRELKSGSLKRVSSEIESIHQLRPRLYHRPEAVLGKAAARLIEILRSAQAQA